MNMSMNPWLAQAYGTAGVTSEDTEKLAQAELFQKVAQVAQQTGVDLSQLSEQELQELAAILANEEAAVAHGQVPQGVPQQGQQFPAQQGQVIYPPQGQPTQPQFVPQQQGQVVPQQGQQQDPAAVEQQLMKEAQAKFEEADFLGRTMAHAYVNELTKIAQAQEATAVAQQQGQVVQPVQGQPVQPTLQTQQPQLHLQANGTPVQQDAELRKQAMFGKLKEMFGKKDEEKKEEEKMTKTASLAAEMVLGTLIQHGVIKVGQ